MPGQIQKWIDTVKGWLGIAKPKPSSGGSSSSGSTPKPRK